MLLHKMYAILRRMRKAFFYTLLLVVTVCFLYIFIMLFWAGVFKNVDKVSRIWQTDPIVSLYVPLHYKRCSPGHERVSISYTLGSMRSSLPEIKSKFWRMGTLCMKRGGTAVISHDIEKLLLSEKESYNDRPLPDQNGQCHNGFKKCGDGSDNKEGAICFPLEQECPITNVLVLPVHQAPPTHGFWEPAGTFAHNHHTLYVRREYIGELPVIDVAFQLTEFDANGTNIRGVCFDEPRHSQFLSPAATLVHSDSSATCSYAVALPAPCTTSDGRYRLVDQLPLSEHFVQNLATLELTGKEEDYEYAVRAAFQDYHDVTMGMYISHEAPWSEKCSVKRELLHSCDDYTVGCMLVLFLAASIWTIWNSLWTFERQEELRYLYDFCGFLWVFAFLIFAWWLIKQVEYLYDAGGDVNCTDPFTGKALQQLLQPAKTTVYTLYLMFSILGLLIMDSAAWYMWATRSHTIELRNIRLSDRSVVREMYLHPIAVVPVAR